MLVFTGLLAMLAGCAGAGKAGEQLDGPGIGKCFKLSPAPAWGARKVCAAQNENGRTALIMEGDNVDGGGQGSVALETRGESAFGDMMVSPDELYLALLTASEGGPVFQVISLPELFEKPSRVEVVVSIDVSPGGTYVKSWESSEITLASDFDLTIHPMQRKSEPGGGRMLFKLDVMTGDLWRIR